MSQRARASTWPGEDGVRCTDCSAHLPSPEFAYECFEGMADGINEVLPVPVLTYCCGPCADKRDAPVPSGGEGP